MRPARHLGVHGGAITRLEVVGGITRGDTQVVDLSMPPADLGPLVLSIFSYSFIFAPVLAYGLLWHIVRTINARV